MRAGRSHRRRAALAATALVATLGAASAARAEEVRVGAGEHADFSRVVLNLTPPEGWRVEQSADGVVIRLPGAAGPFLDDAVTVRRRAHRVDSFETRRVDGATEVRLGFNCDCAATAYVLDGRAIVIDVRDGAPATAENAEPAPAESAPDDAQETAENDDGASEDPREVDVEFAQAQLLDALQRAEEEGFLEFREGSPLAARPPEPEAAPADETTEAADAAPEETPQRAAEEAVEEAVEEDAAAAGEETAAETPQDTVAATPGDAPQATPAAPGDIDTADAATDAPPDDAALAATPAEDALAPEAATPPAFNARYVGPCLPDDALDVAAWRTDGPFHTVLAARRSAVYDAVNFLDTDAVRDLARHYLVNGLGLEAAATPESFGVDTEEIRIVAAMGRVLDGAPLEPGDPFDRLEACPGRHGLWQAAAMAEIDPIAAAAAYAASGRSLARTPEPIRRMLGGRIGRALAAAGDYDAARELLRLLNRSVAPPSAEMLLFEAEILIDEGRDAPARALLRQVADSRDPLSVVGLVRLADLLHPRRDRVQFEAIAIRLSDAATEWRGEPYGVTLAAAEAKLRARFGDLFGAIDAIDVIQARLDPPSPRLIALRGALLETEIAAIAARGDSQRIADAIEIVTAAASDAEGVRLRLLLAEALIASDTAHLTPLVLPPELQLADPRAAEIALRAEAAADLTGAPERYPDAPPTGAPVATAPGAAPIETADAQPAADFAFAELRRRAIAAYLGPPHQRGGVIAELEVSPHPDAPALLSMLREPDGAPRPQLGDIVQTPAVLGDGRALLQDLEAELDLMKELARDG